MAKNKKGGDLQQAMPAANTDTATEDAEQSYETKRHFDTLMEAEEIKNDPTKMEKVHKMAGRHANAIRSIADLKTHYNNKYGPKPKKPPVSKKSFGGM